MLLAIESSTPHASLALLDRGAPGAVWTRAFTSERAHNALLFAPLAEALDRCGRKLDLIAVGRGPGSYGGVRVGMAVAQGLSLALGAPVIGLSSLEAYPGDGSPYGIIGDARRGSWFLARVEEGALAAEPELADAEALLAGLSRWHRERLPVYTADAALAASHPGVVHALPGAAALARRAASLGAAAIAGLAATPLEPHYLRAPYITTPR